MNQLTFDQRMALYEAETRLVESREAQNIRLANVMNNGFNRVGEAFASVENVGLVFENLSISPFAERRRPPDRLPSNRRLAEDHSNETIDRAPRHEARRGVHAPGIQAPRHEARHEVHAPGIEAPRREVESIDRAPRHEARHEARREVLAPGIEAPRHLEPRRGIGFSERSPRQMGNERQVESIQRGPRIEDIDRAPPLEARAINFAPAAFALPRGDDNGVAAAVANALPRGDDNGVAAAVANDIPPANDAAVPNPRGNENGVAAAENDVAAPVGNQNLENVENVEEFGIIDQGHAVFANAGNTYGTRSMKRRRIIRPPE